MARQTLLSSDIDFERPGKQVGSLTLPLAEPWEGRTALHLPFAQIRNGSGPTVLLLGGNHGDEYEGPLTLGRLIRELDPGCVQGRLLLLPALNLPAVLYQRRESPLDGKNLNRVFPGRADGSPTEQIAHYLDSVLYPLCDAQLDLHGGGTLMELIPTTMTVSTDDARRAERERACVLAFNAPLQIEIAPDPAAPTATRRGSERGLLAIGVETGGGGAVTADSLGWCERGVRNVLAHLEVLSESPPPALPAVRTRFTRNWGFPGRMEAPERGVFVPRHDLWDEVGAGEPAGQLHFPEEPGRPPLPVRYPAGGMIAARRAHGGVEQGTVLYWIVQDWE